MVKVKYAQIGAIDSVLFEWWTVPGLPVAFQRSVLAIKRTLEENGAQFEELRKKFIEDYAAKDENGNVKRAQRQTGVDEDGNPVVEEAGILFADPAAADARWTELLLAEFECPALKLSDLEAHAERLGLTLQKFAIIEDLLTE